MAQHGISVSEDVFRSMQQCLHRHRSQGRNFSHSRMLDYLINFEQSIMEKAYQILQLPVEQQLKAHQDMVLLAADYKPPTRPRGNYRPSRYATIDQRAAVMDMLRIRLGMDDPPKELVDHYLDQGGVHSVAMDQAIRANVLLRQAQAAEVERDQKALEPDIDRATKILAEEMRKDVEMWLGNPRAEPLTSSEGDAQSWPT